MIKPLDYKEAAAEHMQKQDVQKRAAESALNITVLVDESHRLFLGNEQVGTVDDVSQFREKLTQALERRKQALNVDGRDRVPGGEDEAGQKVVNVCAPPSLKYGEIVKVVEVIKAVGGEPIGLQNCSAAP